MATTNFPTQRETIKASLVFGTAWFDVANATEVTIEAVDEPLNSTIAAWSSATFDVLWASEYGSQPREFASAKDITHAVPNIIGLEVSGVAWLAVRVDTAEASVHVGISVTSKDAQN